VAHYCLIATDFGPIGLAWSGRGLIRLQLPDETETLTKARLIRRIQAVEADPPAWLEPTVADLRRYFSGEETAFPDASLDLESVPDFHQALYREMRKLGWGETLTYGELATRVGMPGAAQSVGQAMGRNPIPVIIPCHRILASGNTLGGFSAPGGTRTKLKLFAIEGIRLGLRDPSQLGFGF